ncbi:NAD(P)H-dependent oxidoreductase, partial [Neisseria sp. P0015.S006]
MSNKVSILVGSLRKGSFARKVAQNVIPKFP